MEISFGSYVRTIKFGLSEKHTKFEKIFLMVLTNQLIYLVNVKIMRKIFFKLCVLLKKSELYILQGKIGKTEKNRKENHTTKVTKIPKPKDENMGWTKHILSKLQSLYFVEFVLSSLYFYDSDFVYYWLKLKFITSLQEFIYLLRSSMSWEANFD